MDGRGAAGHSRGKKDGDLSATLAIFDRPLLPLTLPPTPNPNPSLGGGFSSRFPSGSENGDGFPGRDRAARRAHGPTSALSFFSTSHLLGFILVLFEF